MDNRSLFSQHSSERNLVRERGSDRSQKLVHVWVNSFPPGNLLTPASELIFSCPGSATTDRTVQSTAPGNPPENPSNVAGYLSHLEMLSQDTRPGIAISIAQQVALYREYLHAQLQQSVSDQRVDRAHSPSGSGVVNPETKQSADVQNFALSTLQPPMQPPRPPTLVMASSKSNNFAPGFQQTRRQLKK